MILNNTDKFALALMDCDINFRTDFDHHKEDFVIPYGNANVHFVFENDKILEIKTIPIDKETLLI